MNEQQRALDQFYTKPEVAGACFQYTLRVLANIPALQAPHFVEPAAGAGSFYALLPETRRYGLDLAPRFPGVHEGDFLAREERFFDCGREQVVVIGNPPFGKRGARAVAFFNAASRFADTFAMIVPVTFRKYAIHKKLAPGYRWIAAKQLGRDAFQSPAGALTPVNTEFQIWTRLAAERFSDRRQFQPAPYQHPLFAIHQYNNTRAALKIFEKPFDFAVPCQGFQDYTRRETRAAACEKNKQWMLFKTTHASTRHKLWALDYRQLAYHCATRIPGFRKNDVVTAYTEAHGRAPG